MLKQAAINYYKSASNVARAIGVSPAAVSKWGAVIPKLSAQELARASGGNLQVREEMYVRGRPVVIDLTAPITNAA